MVGWGRGLVIEGKNTKPLETDMKFLIPAACLLTLAACDAPQVLAPLPSVTASAQTEPVKSSDDAADDPAIWINGAAPEDSLILGTDKQSGLYVYDLSGAVKQFLPTGRLNNVDLRQAISVGDWTGDLAVASNRSDNTVAVYQISDAGEVAALGAFASELEEPYGICMGTLNGTIMVGVMHKTGDALIYALSAPTEVSATYRLKFETQLEGCVFDEASNQVFIGEELAGIWVTDYRDGAFKAPVSVDVVGGASGLVADIEGLSIYRRGNDAFLVASSQGDNSFALYDLKDMRFIGRFRVAADQFDAVEDTDGLETVGTALGAQYPHGLLVVQDGVRPDGAFQNFKLIDWRQVETILLSDDE